MVRIRQSSSPWRTIAAPPTKFPQRRIPSMLLIQNGRVLDPASKTDAAKDVLLDGEVIKEVGARGRFASLKDAQVLDATGLIVAPGFIDMHVHLREPGQESSETIASGAAAAVAGGFTTICAMRNTNPINDNAAVTRFVIEKGERAGFANVLPIGAITKNSGGTELAEMGDMK